MLSACRLQAAGKARGRVSGHAKLSRGDPCCLLHMEEVVARVVLVQNGEGLEEVLEVPRRGKG